MQTKKKKKKMDDKIRMTDKMTDEFVKGERMTGKSK